MIGVIVAISFSKTVSWRFSAAGPLGGLKGLACAMGVETDADKGVATRGPDGVGVLLVPMVTDVGPGGGELFLLCSAAIHVLLPRPAPRP